MKFDLTLQPFTYYKYEIMAITALLGCYVYNNVKLGRGVFGLRFSADQLIKDCKSSVDVNSRQLQVVTSIFSQFYFDKNMQSRRVLDHFGNEGISVQTIYKYSPLIAVDQYRKFTSEIRKRRRLIRTINQDQYVKIILEYQQEIDQLLERSREEVVYDCEIDLEEFENMKIRFEATQDLSLLIKNAKKYLKEIGTAELKQISQQKNQQIIKEEFYFIKSKVYDRLRKKLQNEYDLCQDQILKIIETLIDDIIYERFGYEREQIQNSLTNKYKGLFVKQLKQLNNQRQKLQSDIGNFEINSQQSDVESVSDKTPQDRIRKNPGLLIK